MARLAARHGLPFHLRAATSSPRKGESVEAWAREQRHFAIAEVTRETGVDADGDRTYARRPGRDGADGAVTGSGIQGMSGIAPVTGTWVNPLLDVTREEIVAFCRSLHLRPRTDPTNADTRFLRNAIRLRGLPALERAVGRSLQEPLARTAAGLREDADELTRQTFAVLDDVIDETPDGVDLLATRLLDLPRAIAGRVVANAVYRCGFRAPGRDVMAVLDLAAGRPGRRRDLSSGLKARRDRQYVRLTRPSPGAGEAAPPRPGKGKS